MRAAAVLALLSGLALLWLVVGREPERARSSATRPEAEPAGASAPLGERREAAPTRAEGASTAVRSETTPESAPPAAAPPPPRTELNGTLVVLDERGIEHRGESGRLALDVGAVSRREVPVLGGRWTLGLAGEAPDAAVRFRSCVVGGAPAALEAGEPVELVGEDEIVLRVRWSAVPLLHVVADDTGLPLDDVSLCELPTRLRGSVADAGHPGMLAELASERGSSPIRLERDADPNGGSRVLFARAPGYEWGRIEIPEDARGGHVLRLAPAGALEVVLVADEYVPELEIRLLRVPDGVEVLALQHDSRGSVVLDPLAVGRHVIEARNHGRLVGDAEVEVVAGERASATLALRPPSEKRVALEGVLELQGRHDWPELRLGVSGRWYDGGLHPWSWSLPLAEMIAAGSTYRWRVGETVPGLHRAVYFDFVAEFEVGPEGTRDARIVVPAERRLRVWLVDAETGRHVESEPFHVAMLNPRSTSDSAGAVAPRTSPMELWLYPVPVLLTTTSVQYEAVERWIEAGTEPRDVVLLLRRLP